MQLSDLRPSERAQVAAGLPGGSLDDAIEQLAKLAHTSLLPLCAPVAPTPPPRRRPPAPAPAAGTAPRSPRAARPATAATHHARHFEPHRRPAPATTGDPGAHAVTDGHRHAATAAAKPGTALPPAPA